MADSIVPRSKLASDEASTQTAAETYSGAGLRVNIRPSDLDFAEYTGTRAEIEAEGLIPAGIVWPERNLWVRWEAGGLRYSLSRTRPEGMRGPRKVWISGDCWCLRFEPLQLPDFGLRIIQRRTRELAAEIHRRSPQGQRDWEAQFRRSRAALYDEKFQAFKALIPGLVPPRRGRRKASPPAA